MIKKYMILLLFVLLSSCEKSRVNDDILIKFYGDALEDIGFSVAAVQDGYIIAGQFTEVARIGSNLIDGEKSVQKMGIIRTGSNGNVIWKKSFGDKLAAAGMKTTVLGDGSIICTGYAIDSVTLQKDIFIVKVDADGTGLIQKVFKKEGNQYGIDIIETPEGFLLLGTTDVERQPLTDSTGNAAGKKDILLQRLNAGLEPIVSAIAIGFPGDDIGAAVKPDINGGYIVAGTTDRSDQPASVQDGNNIFLLRVNSDGSAIQPIIIGGIPNESASDIEVLNDGYLIAGTVGNGTTGQKGFVWKMPENIYADPLTAHEINLETSSGAAVSFTVNAISRYRTNSFVMAGQSGTGLSAKMLIFATDEAGNLLGGKKLILGGTGLQVAYDVISDVEDNVIAVGQNSYEKNSMISLVKVRL